MRQRPDDTKTRSLSLSQRLDVRNAFAHEEMDDTETVALIGDGHAFGKKIGARHRCESLSSRSALGPSARSLRNNRSPKNVKVIRDVSRNETQQVRNQMTRPEPQLVERIGEMRS